MNTLRLTSILVVLILLLQPLVVQAGPPEPPESTSMFIRQYESIRHTILMMVESQDKKELLLLLDVVGMKFFYAKTAAELTKTWAMLGRLAALVAETQKAMAYGLGSTPNGILLSAPSYFSCKMTRYPALRGYILECSMYRTYWCQGLRCKIYWQNN